VSYASNKGVFQEERNVVKDFVFTNLLALLGILGGERK
jgi:hypothetical protein